jgi:copper chaperone CopZ
MTRQYQLSGLTCDACTYKVKHLLSQVPGVKSVEINATRDEASIELETPVAFDELQGALRKYPKYAIDNKQVAQPNFVEESPKRSWWEIYRPILLIFGYITGTTILLQAVQGRFDFMEWMRHFMAGFFLVFSFFKLLNLRGFADSYRMYDVVARYFPAWAYLYAFLELGLGLANLLNWQPFWTSVITLLVMSVSIIGVLQTVLNKRQIQCACLGAVFNLPMSTVTIVEDGLMIAMSAAMLYLMW